MCWKPEHLRLADGLEGSDEWGAQGALRREGTQPVRKAADLDPWRSRNDTSLESQGKQRTGGTVEGPAVAWREVWETSRTTALDLHLHPGE